MAWGGGDSEVNKFEQVRDKGPLWVGEGEPESGSPPANKFTKGLSGDMVAPCEHTDKIEIISFLQGTHAGGDNLVNYVCNGISNLILKVAGEFPAASFIRKGGDSFTSKLLVKWLSLLTQNQ